MGEDVDVGAQVPYLKKWVSGVKRGVRTEKKGEQLFVQRTGREILLIGRWSGGIRFPVCGRGGFQGPFVWVGQKLVSSGYPP